ncbi:hypothetical protein CROQUDRAFT_663691 [Cronartium quercuum f. sp. fusiforme G11]|uniref:Uncharacterized protein n=1 Tax=Cronartium quercuum f. sp. fusiforme G11 TaxID=708437 RepID=A0A9P6ND64_9BASI|nr:hypothetical protein CROQUDRAFT_663691 [Cronartium quercuum f. sp. fusiforme G11]
MISNKSNFDCVLNTPTPIDRSNSSTKPSPSVHFSPHIHPRRLFNSEQPFPLSHPAPPLPDLSNLFSSPNLRYPISPSQSIPIKSNTSDWLQEFVDQPKQANKPTSPFSTAHVGHFPSTPHTGLQNTYTSSPLQHSISKQPSPPAKSLPIGPPASQARLPPTTPNSRIPISLNPKLAAGVKIGHARLIERLRVNLIYLVLVYTVTSTQTFAALTTAVDRRFPQLSTPLHLIEWLLLFTLVANVLHISYKLKTRPPTTHIELPLTPQQIRGTPKSGLRNHSSSSPSTHLLSPGSNIKLRSLQADPSPAPKAWSSTILQNPPSQSTNQLFKRSSNLSRSLTHSSGPQTSVQLSQSLRKVSNPNSLHRLLEETL